MLQRFSPLPVVEQSEKEQSFDLREAISFAWRHWKFIGSVVSVTLLIAIVYILKQTPVYTATAQVLLEPPKESSPASATPYQDSVD
jgi:succinoglycan biosynthesis transport protein ExoP